MTEQTEPQYDHSVVGVEVEVGSFEVTKEQIQSFCQALGETNPLYIDEDAAAAGPHGGIVAPPAFFIAAASQLRPGPDPKVVYGNTSFAAGQHCEFHQPMRPGDTITVHTAVNEIYEKTGRTGRMLFVVRRTTYRNQRQDLVAVVEGSMVYRQVDRE